ncbi:MAG: glycosyltransferase family 4 protein [Actinomycetota bacterium]|nr:glycosyltransferase family 4 protein [Actinomycetota bacterium]
MRIGVVAPVWVAVPPKGYGGVEVVVSLLVEELVDRGHDVTLFASGDSTTGATLRFAYEVAPTDRLGEVEPDATHVGWAYRTIVAAHAAGEGFDLVHDHTDLLGAAFAAALPAPVVHTVHLPIEQHRRAFLRRFGEDTYLTAVSDHQRDEAPELPWRARVHNAVDVESFPFREDDDGYLLCLGRVCAQKGQDLAIDVARKADLPLVIAGRMHPADAEFFHRAVEPRVDGDAVVFLGEVSNERKRSLVAGARALLFTVREPEAFGLVMVEAMASGTPVVAEPLGAVPEIVCHGETGFLASGVDAMADAVRRTGEISAGRCRDEAMARFHPRGMADGYEAVYRDVVASR